MIYDLKGVVTFIGEPKQLNGGSVKRELWIAPFVFDENTGKPTPRDSNNSICLTSISRGTPFANIGLGQTVIVKFDINGYVFDKKDGTKSCMNQLTVKSIKVEGVGTTPPMQQTTPAEPQPTVAPQPQQVQPQQNVQSTAPAPATAQAQPFQPKQDEALPF